jgi:hypothetical protein
MVVVGRTREFFFGLVESVIQFYSTLSFLFGAATSEEEDEAGKETDFTTHKTE